MKKFFELAASDKAVQKELQKASLEALKAFVESKGLADEAQKVLKEVMTKVAEAHGFKDEMEEISPEEMKAVAGGFFLAVAGGDCRDILTWQCKSEIY